MRGRRGGSIFLILIAGILSLAGMRAGWGQQSAAGIDMQVVKDGANMGAASGGTWMIIAGAAMLLSQLGFALLNTGLTRAKNAAHTFATVMMVFPLACAGFFIFGFAFGWGDGFHGAVSAGWPQRLAALDFGISWNGWGILGLKGFGLMGIQDPSVLGLFLYMAGALSICATIVTGAMCERWRWLNFCLYGIWSAVPFGIFASWTWGGGWLAQLGSKGGWGHGYVDLGSGGVHLMGGITALTGTLVIGARIGKFGNRRPQPIPGHNLPLSMAGTLILALGLLVFLTGWVGAGSDLSLSVICVNALLAMAGSTISAMVVTGARFGKPDPSMLCNGMIAGLVSISSPCGFVQPLAALLIGTVAGIITVYGVSFWDNRRVDDAVGAITVHGLAGLWGVLSVGLFASGDYGFGWQGVGSKLMGIFPIGHPDAEWLSNSGWTQLGVQVLGGMTSVVFAFLAGWSWFKLSNVIFPLRVSREEELQGCDISESGALAYPDYELKSAPSLSEMREPATLV